ncbi:unnamed protein product [Phyllotreta striolata]|uniref:G-protein coupled receptors family 1 profile domain-containing protein n=1 Tax=Phyllotreta striolata TaxID=444603 RepID=A0A9N9TXR6_PHYSR|nr:unnamed protein product [Phyllotreta striolata]
MEEAPEECSEALFGPERDPLYIVAPLTAVYLLIFIAGSIGNTATCLVIAANKSMRTATNYYLFSLAVSDQLLLIAGLPAELYTFWRRRPYVFGGAFCFARGLLSEASGNSSVLVIGAFTAERYLAVCWPFLAHALSDPPRAVRLIAGVWVASAALAVPQAWPLRVELVAGTCRLCVVSNDSYVEPMFEMSSVVLFVVPMAVITVLYVLIGFRLKSSKGWRGMSSSARMRRRSSWKVVRMLVAVVVAFFICWAPFHLQRLTSIYQKPTEETKEAHMKFYAILTYISGIFYYLSATVNPILYNIMSAKFREAFKETFSCCWSKENRVQSYSTASKSTRKCPDSNDSYTQENYSMQSIMLSVHKNSPDSTATATLNGALSKK